MKNPIRKRNQTMQAHSIAKKAVAAGWSKEKLAERYSGHFGSLVVREFELLTDGYVSTPVRY